MAAAPWPKPSTIVARLGGCAVQAPFQRRGDDDGIAGEQWDVIESAIRKQGALPEAAVSVTDYGPAGAQNTFAIAISISIRTTCQVQTILHALGLLVQERIGIVDLALHDDAAGLPGHNKSVSVSIGEQDLTGHAKSCNLWDGPAMLVGNPGLHSPRISKRY